LLDKNLRGRMEANAFATGFFKLALFWRKKVAENLFKSGLCLPSGSNLSVENLQMVANNILNE